MLKLVPPFSIVIGAFTPLIQLAAPGRVDGTISKPIITTTNEIFKSVPGALTIFFLSNFLVLRISAERIDNPIDDKIMTEIDAKTSNLTKAELM